MSPDDLNSFDATVRLGLAAARHYGHVLPDALEVTSADMHSAACTCGRILIVERVGDRWVMSGGVLRRFHATPKAHGRHAAESLKDALRRQRDALIAKAKAETDAVAAARTDVEREADREAKRQRQRDWHAKRKARRDAETAEFLAKERASRPVPVFVGPRPSAARPEAKVYLPPKGSIAFSLLGQM